MDFLRLAGDIYRQADKAAGGILPGGGTPNPVVRALSPAKAALERSIKEAALNAAASASNVLPDRVNLYTRYVTGLGNRKLELDPSTLQALRAASERQPTVETVLFPASGDIPASMMTEPAYGPGIPATGQVIPYGQSVPKSVTNTLGSYGAYVDPEANLVTFRDTYDMINSSEDPDLVSGKIQPHKAWKSIESLWNPSAFAEIRSGIPTEGRYAPEEFQASAENPTFSPATQLGRALLYALPVKPKPYEVEASVPLFRK